MSHADKVIEAIKAMTPEERVQSLISAGIIREDGTLMPQYGGTSTSGDIPTPETDAAAFDELDRLRKELEQVKKERSEAEYDLQMTQVMAEANITTAGRERREAKEWADKCEASQRAWQENHAKALREVDFVRTKNEELEAWARELIEERNTLSTELAAATARAEEAERIIRNGEEQAAALKRLVPFCHHPANLVIGSAEGWICCECWAQQNEDALRKIAALPTDQTASPTQCEAVLIAMDALKANPSARPDELTAERDSLRAEVDRLRKEREWQPIETAPKDGSQILIWTQRLGFAVVTHDPDDPMPTDIVPSGHHFFVHDGKHGPYAIRGDYPTHWMPLPDAAKQEEAEA